MNPALVVIILCTFLVVVVMQMRFNAIASGLARLSRLEAKVDLLLKNANIKYDPTVNVPPDVVEALRRGAKIDAIKRYREATGVGLKEAKDFVEGLQGKIGTF
jgi:hypothetical protein